MLQRIGASALEKRCIGAQSLQPTCDPARLIERLARDGANDTVVVGPRGRDGPASGRARGSSPRLRVLAGVTPIDFVAAIEREGAAIAHATASDPDAALAYYPTWTTLDLVAHTGSVHRWVAEIVDRGLDEPPPRWPHHERDPARLLAWFERGLANLVEALARVDPAREVWTMAADRTVGFWRRRMAHETVTHRWDAEHAIGTPDPIEPQLAVTGIPETLEIHIGRPLSGAAVGGLGERIALHCTDVEGDWTVCLKPNGLEVEDGPGGADVTLAGTASSVWLALMGRPGPAVDVLGERRALEAFRRALALVAPPSA